MERRELLEQEGVADSSGGDREIVNSERTTTGAPVTLYGASVSIEDTAVATPTATRTIATPTATRTIDSLDAHNEVVTP